MQIIKGPHRDLVGLILKAEKDNDVLLVQLEISEQNVKVFKAEVAPVPEEPEQPQ